MNYPIVEKIDEIQKNFYILIHDFSNDLSRAVYHNKRILEYLREIELNCSQKDKGIKQLNDNASEEEIII